MINFLNGQNARHDAVKYLQEINLNKPLSQALPICEVDKYIISQTHKKKIVPRSKLVKNTIF